MIVQSTLFIKDAIIYRHHHRHHQLCRLLLRLLRERVSLNLRHPLWIKSLYVLSVFITATKPSSSSNYKFRRFSRGFQNGCIVKWKSHPPELRSSPQSAIQVWWYGSGFRCPSMFGWRQWKRSKSTKLYFIWYFKITDEHTGNRTPHVIPRKCSSRMDGWMNIVVVERKGSWASSSLLNEWTNEGAR